MTMTVPLSDARANLSKLIDEAVATHQRVEVTRNGVPAVVLLSSDDYAALLETLEILSDAELVRDLSRARASQDEDISTEELLASIDPARRGRR